MTIQLFFYRITKIQRIIYLFLFPTYLMFLISILIEINRTFFDLVQEESDLISGLILNVQHCN